MSLTPAQRSLRGRIANAELRAKYSGEEITRAARQAATEKLNGALVAKYELDTSAPDFAERLAAARSAHFLRIGFKASKSRSRKAARRAEAAS